MHMDQVDTLRASRVSFDAHERINSGGSFSGPLGSRLSKDGWFTGPGGASSTEVLNALRLQECGNNNNNAGELATVSANVTAAATERGQL